MRVANVLQRQGLLHASRQLACSGAGQEVLQSIAIGPGDDDVDGDPSFSLRNRVRAHPDIDAAVANEGDSSFLKHGTICHGVPRRLGGGDLRSSVPHVPLHG
jgi:hypothetical protein